MRYLKLIEKQISKSVLPYYYSKVLNSTYLKVFRFTACISIITLFLCKGFITLYFLYLLLVISYSYMVYQCVTISVKIYSIHSTVPSRNTKYVRNSRVLSHVEIMCNIIALLIVLIGVPIVNDTILDIIGDSKYIIQQMLGKKKK